MAILPSNQSVKDTKPNNSNIIDNQVIFTETRYVGMGQWIPLAFFTYPVAGTFTGATRI